MRANETGHVPRGVSDEADSGEQFVDLIVRQFFSTLPWPEAQVLRDGPRKKVWPLRDHAHSAAKVAGRALPVVSAVEEYGPAGRLIQPVQQPEEGGLSRSARADDGERLAPTNVEGRARDEDFPRDAAGRRSARSKTASDWK